MLTLPFSDCLGLPTVRTNDFVLGYTQSTGKTTPTSDSGSQVYGKNFKRSVFAACTINFGPQTVTSDHCDSGNYGPGGCTISSAGYYSDKQGGEIVLWTLGVVVRFPAACTVIIPSAIVRHSNLAILPGERRYSITQYSAGALFRFRGNGFQNDKDRLAHATAKEKVEWLRVVLPRLSLAAAG